VDKEGNAITGMHTIEGKPWADGYFVEGVPLNNAGSLKFEFFRGLAGQRKPTGTAMDLVFEKGRLRFATGAFAASTLLADIQFLVNLIDYKVSAKDAVSFPRFGNRLRQQEDQPIKNSVSPRIKADVIQALQNRGIYFEKVTYKNGLDTGLGAVAVIHEDGTKEGAFAPLVEHE
jgi:gamma-glutamyltranspeptidase